MNTLIRTLLTHYRWRLVGTVLALVLALTYLHFGFWRFLFILICAGIGYFIGTRFDADDDWKSVLERMLPPLD